MPVHVSIQGSGIAALACQQILQRFGFVVHTAPGERSGERSAGPVVLLSDRSVDLIRDVLGMPELFSDAPRITKRIVAWNPGTPSASLDHSAAIVQSLPIITGTTQTSDADWAICSTRPVPQAAQEIHFGNRQAYASIAILKHTADPQTCWIEALQTGWLFLISDSKGSGWLLSIGQATDEALGDSTLVEKQIESIARHSGQFPAHPRILSPLCGAGWIACGAAAIGFDPICGDGTAHAIREGVLASACIQAINRGEDKTAVLGHYERRLIEALQKHLLLCRDFYRSGHRGPWWEAQLSSLRDGYEWCQKRLAEQQPYTYALRGFELVR